jgi:RNA polymerase sigma factor (TIGR02999 family)
MATDHPLTSLIHRAHQGDSGAAEDLYAAVYDELRRIAHRVRGGGSAQTINTTALVHEAWIKLAVAPAANIESRAHFKHIAARAMRQVLVDEARSRNALKRGGGLAAVTLEEGLIEDSLSRDAQGLLDLDDALRSLERSDPRAARVVECRFFGGMDVEETAATLEVSSATVKRDWRFARAWLALALGGADPS